MKPTDDEDRTTKSTNEARQGQRAGVVTILVGSLALAIFAGLIFAIYIWNFQ